MVKPNPNFFLFKKDYTYTIEDVDSCCLENIPGKKILEKTKDRK